MSAPILKGTIEGRFMDQHVLGLLGVQLHRRKSSIACSGLSTALCTSRSYLFFRFITE